jgi:hypothetical protein
MEYAGFCVRRACGESLSTATRRAYFSTLREAMPDTTEQIRELAYHLWDARGRPHGADIEHWVEARRILANGANGHSDSADEPTATKPSKAKKHRKKAKPEKVDRQKKKKG